MMVLQLRTCHNEIAEDAKLIKGQIICYRASRSSFEAADYYGTVEDLLVVSTHDSNPELRPLRSKDCRLPS